MFFLRLVGELKISVVIPSRSRPEALKNLLLMLGQQEVIPDEVIVVNHEGDRCVKYYLEAIEKARRILPFSITHVFNPTDMLGSILADRNHL